MPDVDNVGRALSTTHGKPHEGRRAVHHLCQQRELEQGEGRPLRAASQSEHRLCLREEYLPQRKFQVQTAMVTFQLSETSRFLADRTEW